MPEPKEEEPAQPAGPGTRASHTPPANLAAAQKHNLAGRQLMEAGRYEQAIAEFSKAVTIAPDFARAYNARGFTWFQLHTYKRALEDLDMAIRLDPNYANA